MHYIQAETLNLKFDIDKLRSYFEEVIRPLEPVFNGRSYHGWSLLSDDGDWRSGFHHGSQVYDKSGENQFDEETWKNKKYKFDTEFDQKTSLYQGYAKEVLDKLESIGLYPRRARIVGLPPQTSTNWHRDHQDNIYWARLHIPILTNEKCVFKTESETVHMRADGSCYLVDTACMHQAFNDGDTDRYHLIMQVWDTGHISERFRYYPDAISNLSPKSLST